MGIIHLPGRYSHRPIVRTGSTPVLIFPRVDKSSNGDGACEGSRVRNRSTRKVCSRREDRLCVYLLPAQQLPVEVTHPVRLVSLSFIVLRPPATPFVFVLCFSLSLTLFLSSFLPLFVPLRSCHPGLGGRFIPTPLQHTGHTRTHNTSTHETASSWSPRPSSSSWNEDQARFG